MLNLAPSSFAFRRLFLSLLLAQFNVLTAASADDFQGAVSILDLEKIPRENWPDILSNIEHYNIMPF